MSKMVQMDIKMEPKTPQEINKMRYRHHHQIKPTPRKTIVIL